MKVGVVGLGIAGQRHLEAYAADPRVAIDAVADLNRELGQEVAGRFGASYFENFLDLLETDLEAVSVCVPHALLADIARLSAEQGKHILLEKPMATSVREAKRVVRSAEDNGVRLMVGYVHRFREEITRARDLLSEGRIGAPQLVVERSAMGGDERAPAWIWDRQQSGGGVLMYNGVHSIDRLLWLLDRPVERVRATARTLTHEPSVEDALIATMEFSGGALANLVAAFPPYSHGGHWNTEIYGARGVLSIATGERLEVHTREGRHSFVPGEESRFQREIGEFLSAIEEGRPPLPGGTDGLRVLEVVEAAYISAAEGGEWVKVAAQR